MLRKGLAIAALCWVVGCSNQDGGRQPEARQDPTAPQPVVETRHYRIRSSATDAQTRAVGKSVESLYAAYTETFGNGRQHGLLELVMYKDQAEFKANNRSKPWAEAYYLEPRAYAYPGGGENPHHWMLHEATHQLLRQVSGFKLRRWANEGVASYFGAGTLHAGVLEPSVPDSGAYPIWWLALLDISGDMQADINRGVVMPIEQVVEDTGPPIAGNVNGYYLHYWSLTHYMLHGDAGKHRDAFLVLLQRGGDPVEFRRLIGPYAQVQRGWYDHLLALVKQREAIKKNGSP